MLYNYTLILQLLLFVIFILKYYNINGQAHRGYYQPGCDLDKAKDCEYDFLQCRLFTGPANDKTTMCNCGEKFYGDCLRRAGCEYHEEYGPGGELYAEKCINLIIDNDCPSPQPLMCSVNCATEGSVDVDNSRIMLFNNYGNYSLRIRICTNVVHSLRLKQYGVVDPVSCNDNNEETADDFKSCARWIPPGAFTPVILPPDTTYIEVDRCVVTSTGKQYCLDGETPVRVYGNSQLFPTSYDVPKTDVSVCTSDADCLGSFCEKSFIPQTCSPKLKRVITGSGAQYKSLD